MKKIFWSMTLLVLLITFVTGCGGGSGGKNGGNGGNGDNDGNDDNNDNGGGNVVQIKINPTAITMDPDDAKQFSATVTGTSNTDVIWSVTGDGAITNGLYNPASTGTYQVTATSVADPNKKANATVEVKTLRFVAVGNSMRRYRTENGTYWIPAGGSTYNYNGIAYGKGIFVAVGGNYLCRAYSNDGGASWSTVETEPGIANSLNGIAYGNGRFVAVGAMDRSIVSTDGGKTWTAYQGVYSSYTFNDIAYGNDRFVAVGANGIRKVSTDGLNWSYYTSSVSETLLGVAYGNGYFIAVGANGCRIKSSDGSIWTSFTKVGGHLRGVAYGNGRFVAVGDKGRRVVFDGNSWTHDQEGGTEALRGVAYGKGRFIAVGDNDRRVISTDGGVNWTDDITDGTLGLNRIAYESELPLD